MCCFLGIMYPKVQGDFIDFVYSSKTLEGLMGIINDKYEECVEEEEFTHAFIWDLKSQNPVIKEIIEFPTRLFKQTEWDLSINSSKYNELKELLNHCGDLDNYKLLELIAKKASIEQKHNNDFLAKKTLNKVKDLEGIDFSLSKPLKDFRFIWVLEKHRPSSTKENYLESYSIERLIYFSLEQAELEANKDGDNYVIYQGIIREFKEFIS